MAAGGDFVTEYFLIIFCVVPVLFFLERGRENKEESKIVNGT